MEKIDKQRQHFVPQWWQKRWGYKNDPRYVLKYNVDTKMFKKIGIRSNWQENMFYGDKELESHLAKHDDILLKEFERFDQNGHIISFNECKCVPTPKGNLLILPKEFFDWEHLMMGISSQIFRSNYFVDPLKQEFDKYEMNTMNTLHIRQFFNCQIAFVLQMFLELRDLNCTAIETNEEIIRIHSPCGISMTFKSPRGRIMLPDSGVLIMNIYSFCHQKYYRYSLRSVGAILIAPISPYKAIVFFDLNAYDWTGQMEYEMSESDEDNLARIMCESSKDELLVLPEHEEWLKGVDLHLDVPFIVPALAVKSDVSKTIDPNADILPQRDNINEGEIANYLLYFLKNIGETDENILNAIQKQIDATTG